MQTRFDFKPDDIEFGKQKIKKPPVKKKRKIKTTHALKFEDLRGRTLESITMNDQKDIVTLTTINGEQYLLYHNQACCESVNVEEVIGDFTDVLKSPILLAEEVNNDPGVTPLGISVIGENEESFTWTFYKLATVKGALTIRWYGCSNGYYSESVSFREKPVYDN